MADEMSPMEFDQENQLATVVVDQPAKTAEPRFYEGTMFGLPRGWIVEIRPRKASSKYYGKVDQFFYEPVTRRQFRSFKAVKKHLGSLNVGQTSPKRKPKTSEVASSSQNFNEKENFETKAEGQSVPFHRFNENVNENDKDGSRSKVAKEDKDKESYPYLDKVANRVRWQLVNGEQNNWNLYVKVPDSTQQRWMDMLLKPDIQQG